MGTIADKLAYLVETKNQIKAAIEAKGVTIPEGATFRDYVGLIEGISGGSEPATYTLITEDGQEVTAVEVGEETVFTATEKDIREGTVAATASGVTTGTAVIPAYHTTDGMVKILAGGTMTVNMYTDKCQYTKLQALICAFNTSLDDSVATEKVAIESKVYAVGSTTVLAEVTVDTENQAINFGFTNEGEYPVVIRYFTYKEEA